MHRFVLKYVSGLMFAEKLCKISLLKTQEQGNNIKKIILIQFLKTSTVNF